MLRGLVALRPLICGFLPFKLDDADKITEFQKQNLLKNLPEEDGFTRVKNIFLLDEFGESSNELRYILNSATMTAFIGAIYGGISESRANYIKFMEKNSATMYDNIYVAKKKIHDSTILSFSKGAWKWGWRLTLFTSTFTVISTTIQVYRGKSSVIEYSLGGLISGALYKANLGMRGAVVGGCLGGVLGTLGGGVVMLMLKMTDSTIDDVRFWNTKWGEIRKEQWKIVYDNEAIEKNDPLMISHDMKINQEEK